MYKVLYSIYGLLLMVIGIRIFKPYSKFKGKRVAIVGPAGSAFEKEDGDYIDDFDYVIRINKALSSWKEADEKFIGKKCNIWFHSFFENTASGGGPLSRELLKEKKVIFLVNPRAQFDAYRRTFNFFKKYRKTQRVYHLPYSFYSKMIKDFPTGLKPTIGYTALYSVLNSECKDVYITGFTFFKTPYAKGYRDHLRDLQENKKHFKKQGIHDADLEFELFQNQLYLSKCQSIHFDKKLDDILKSISNA